MSKKRVGFGEVTVKLSEVEPFRELYEAALQAINVMPPGRTRDRLIDALAAFKED